MIYANHAGTSWPKPPEVHRSIAEALELAPNEGEAIIESARATLCAELGIDRPERFLFTGSCTAALAVAIGDLPWQAGDIVITSALEHHALGRPVTQLAQQRGVRHQIAPYRPGAPIDLDFVRDRLAEGGVRCIALSAASNVTGELLPITEVAALAHEYGALCLVDAAQSFGIVPTKVTELGADLLTFAGHKGPLGPQGIGGFWAAPHVAFETPQAACTLDGPPCTDFPGYCDVGSVNLAGAAGLAAGIAWRRGLDADHARPQALAFVEEIRELGGVQVLAPDAGRTATVSLRIDGLAVNDAEAAFLERGVLIRAGSHCAPMALEALGLPDGTLRISFGPTTSDDDRRAVTAAVASVAESLARP